MDTLDFSPLKLKAIDQNSPRRTERKRSLFPTNSPQTKDGIGRFSPLNYSPEMYSPPLASPSWSITPTKDDKENCMSPNSKIKFDKLLKNKRQLEFHSLSPEPLITKSPRKSRKALSEKNIFKYFEKLPDSPEKQDSGAVYNASLKFNLYESLNKVEQEQTPKINIRNSPRGSKEKKPVALSPRTFYGNMAPILATNQTNCIQGIKRVFRPLPIDSKAKVKLFSDEKKKSNKRVRSKSSESHSKPKKKKEIYPGVYHSIQKPKPKVTEDHVAFMPKAKTDTFREKIKRAYDFSRTPYAVKKKKSNGFYDTAKFTKPERTNMINIENRKFFKSTIVPQNQSVTASVTKKRKLLDPGCWEYFEENDGVKLTKQDMKSSDILDLIEDGIVDEVESEKDQKVSEILLHLTEDEDEEDSLERTRRELISMFEDENSNEWQEKTTNESPGGVVSRLARSTAVLAINENANDFIPSYNQNNDSKELVSTPHRFFPIFDTSNTCSPASSDGKRKKEKPQWRHQDENQMQIDAGQKKFGPTHCPECGLVYQLGEPDDEIQHNLYHSNYNTLRHVGWKNECVVGYFQNDRIIMVNRTDIKSKQSKTEDVLKIVDKELGFNSNKPLSSLNYKAFLYICDKTIVGLLIALPVTEAYKMIVCENDVDICSKETYAVKCGISRLWTHSTYRRQGIAAKMVDCLRRNFMYGRILSREEIAFSIPSVDGKKFAQKYMGRSDYYVYCNV